MVRNEKVLLRKWGGGGGGGLTKFGKSQDQKLLINLSKKNLTLRDKARMGK